jgi:hypothetical protein
MRSNKSCSFRFSRYQVVGALLAPEVLFAIAPAIGRIAAAIRCPEAFHTGLGVIFNMLPKRAPPLMHPVMKMARIRSWTR